MRAHEFEHRGRTPELDDFVAWCCRRLDIQGPLPDLRYSDSKEAQDQHYTGYYTQGDDAIWIYTGGRNLADIMRTVAHELVHFRQRESGQDLSDQAYAGSPAEREADAEAGIMMKHYLKSHPEVLE